METYSLWSKDKGDELTFIKGVSHPEIEGHKLLKTFEAISYNDAMRQYHEFMGWEPYKPMVEDDKC
jgi:hypothetical protein